MHILYLLVEQEMTSPLLSLTVEPPKGTESLTIHMMRVLTSRAPSPLPLLNSRVPKGPWGRVPKGPLLNSRACLRILMVEYLKVLWSSTSPLLSLMVEHLKVLSLSVEPAYASLSVEPPKGTESLTIHMVRVLSLWSSASGP